MHAYRGGDRTVAIQYGPYILSKVRAVFPWLAQAEAGAAGEP